METDLEDLESFSPVMTKDETLAWFSKRLGHAPEAKDFFKLGKGFFQMGAFTRALLCFQHYVLQN